MKEWIIASGKGGAGKTSLVAALAQYLGPRAVLADCDVDAADLALLMAPETGQPVDFVAGQKASIDEAKCRGCGRCARSCPFGAISREGQIGPFHIDPLVCEGCGVCGDVCMLDAVIYTPNHCGEYYFSRTRFDSVMLHARLNPGEDNSGKLVQEVKEQARKQLSANGADRLIVDGPPGIGCPTIASLTGASGLLIVVESSKSGLHDARRLHQLASRMNVPCMGVLNKTGLSEAMDAEARDWLKAEGIELIGEIPYDVAYVESLYTGKTWLEIANDAITDNLTQIFEQFNLRMEAS